MSTYDKRHLRHSQQLTNAAQHVQDPFVSIGSATERESALKELTSENNELLNKARQKSLANPPYRKTKGGKTHRKRGRKHRKTRHRR
jgi:hypothetical protein